MRAVAVIVVLLAGAGAAVALARPDRKDVGVLLVDTRTGAHTRLTSDGGQAAWSRDGRTIFLSGHRSFARYATNGRRLAQRDLQVPAVGAGNVAVSPDERRIAYVAAPQDADEVNAGDLVVATLDGARPQRRLSRAYGTPAWSSDGTDLAVTRWSEADALGDPTTVPPKVAVVPLKGRPLNAGPGGDPTWLPDGRLLVHDDGRLVVTRVDGAERHTIGGGDVWALSPDGRTVAVGLTLVDVASGESRQLGSEPVSAVTWSPDGTRLAATSGDRVLLADQNGNLRELVRIKGRDLGELAWSPDGRKLAVSASVLKPYHD